jgi:tetraacyldisaccharide 4'-kinase
MSDWPRIWNDDGSSTPGSPLKAILYTLSLLYLLITKFRNWLYDHKILKAVKLSCPVISIGNITVGGTGKTPCVIMLAQMLKEQGFHPVVLSRGYGGKSTQSINIISNGCIIMHSDKFAGDEPLLIARSLPGIPVITGPRRILTGQFAISNLDADILICDDAFQHRQIFRDINIVLLDSERPRGNGHLLPRGSLRESWAELSRRADAVILTRSSQTGESNSFIGKEYLLKAIPLFRSRHKAKDIVAGNFSSSLPLSSLKGKKMCAFAGIADPRHFLNTLSDTEAEIVSYDIFSDHHYYSRRELEQIRNNFLKSKADFLITTEKDGMRLLEFKDILETIYFLRVEMEILPDKKLLQNFILQKIADAKQSRV